MTLSTSVIQTNQYQTQCSAALSTQVQCARSGVHSALSAQQSCETVHLHALSALLWRVFVSARVRDSGEWRAWQGPVLTPPPSGAPWRSLAHLGTLALLAFSTLATLLWRLQLVRAPPACVLCDARGHTECTSLATHLIRCISNHQNCLFDFAR